jgi:hypothetical protein
MAKFRRSTLARNHTLLILIPLKHIMRKLLLLLFIPAFAAAQNDSVSHLEGDTLVTKSGFKVAEKQMLKIGAGAMPDGDFKYIRRSSTSLFQYTSSSGYQGLANQANSLSRSNGGLEYKVVRIDKRGTKKNGYIYYPIINVGAIRYEIDIDNAIAAGELSVPDEFKPKKETAATVVIKQEVSVADEITKLKKLLDEGVLTQAEFDAQKKKLLEKQ